MKSETFPVINGLQVVMMRVDRTTGYIIDKDIKFTQGNPQDIYTVFDNLTFAIEEASRLVENTGRLNVGFLIKTKRHSNI